jgi:hypothetical protein
VQRPEFEVADVIARFGREYIEKCSPNAYTFRVLDTLTKCRTAALGGHKERCDCCGRERISYNSCGTRHCPKCQATRQAFWVEDRMKTAFPVKHYHVVFTVPEVLNDICLIDSRSFYSAMFQSVWETLRTFGYSHYGVESGAICVLHTWGQNLSLHPHVHCIVPAIGLNLQGKLKDIGKKGKYLYPERMLSATFRGKIMQSLKARLRQKGVLKNHQSVLDTAWQKKWVVDCEPSFASPQHVVKYLGQYTHRIAISNQRLLNVDDQEVTFLHKDYRDGARKKPVTLSGVEFLRRFSMHILPHRFVKIRYYGIYGSRYKALKQSEKKIVITVTETPQQRLLRLTGFDVYQCPFCKKGRMTITEIFPRIRSPSVVYSCSVTA